MWYLPSDMISIIYTILAKQYGIYRIMPWYTGRPCRHWARIHAAPDHTMLHHITYSIAYHVIPFIRYDTYHTIFYPPHDTISTTWYDISHTIWYPPYDIPYDMIYTIYHTIWYLPYDMTYIYIWYNAISDNVMTYRPTYRCCWARGRAAPWAPHPCSSPRTP